jgi:hypothetical protein
LNDAIAAAGAGTVVSAHVGIDHIAIVAGLNAHVDNPIATRSCDTSIQASIGIDHIGIVAGLDTRLNESIATSSDGAIRARVGIGHIAVVACFDAGAEKAIATGGGDAVVQARVVVAGIGIIARFDASLNESVAAGGQRAIVEAVVTIAVIAVIAYFTRTPDAISAYLESPASGRNDEVPDAWNADVRCVLQIGLDGCRPGTRYLKSGCDVAQIESGDSWETSQIDRSRATQAVRLATACSARVPLKVSIAVFDFEPTLTLTKVGNVSQNHLRRALVGCAEYRGVIVEHADPSDHDLLVDCVFTQKRVAVGHAGARAEIPISEIHRYRWL